MILPPSILLYGAFRKILWCAATSNLLTSSIRSYQEYALPQDTVGKHLSPKAGKLTAEPMNAG
jgi:hypothetical protein